MDEKTNRRIGIFVYDWGMYHYIKDLAIKLAETGYWVYIFFKDWDLRLDYANTNDFDLYKNIRFYNFTTKVTRRQVFKRRYERVLNKIAILLSIPRNHKPEEIIDTQIFIKSKELIGSLQFQCFIGVEKGGLIWAGMLSEIYHCPIVYFSLELYIEDNPILDRVYHILDAERKYHKLAIATIVQDKSRGNVLLNSNGIKQANVIYLPVSAKGNKVTEKSKYLQDKLQIESGKKIVLYFGRIDNTRFMTEIVKMAKDFHDGVILVLHGFGPKRYIDYLQSIADKNKVMFSFDFIAEGEIEKLISSADIGITLYKTTNANDRLVAFSSSKVAYYTQCGIPMIAFDTDSFRELKSAYRCVELIANVDEIPLKVHNILENYDFYRQQSYSAFQKFYNFDENYLHLQNQLEELIFKNQSVLNTNKSSQIL